MSTIVYWYSSPRIYSPKHSTHVKRPLPSFELQVRVSMVCSSWVNAVFIRNDFPELRTNLISALATLDVHELAHGSQKVASEANSTDCFSTWGLTTKMPRSTKVPRCFHFFNSTKSSWEKKRTSETIAFTPWSGTPKEILVEGDTCIIVTSMVWQCTADNQWHQHSSWAESYFF